MATVAEDDNRLHLDSSVDTTILRTMFVVLPSLKSHCESSGGLYDER